ncbi:hypothetical protein [Hymenobacter lapidiphilus]|uniref:Uncharacterized protein n=1 Tax=Hymenobacter lapidiphilus TaxID=2608003 RepID=A0A7Y7U4I2_9BACT|nr:hypothetical protein [Hymenobacter lapidiphilus]NVO29714.1 hypothetical protein [Hymenobacter lapidiphilus]
MSKKYGEVVCTAGCREDGTPIRLYPVPLRYLPAFGKYSLYNWIEVNVERNTTDVRPESYKVVGMPRVVGEMDSKQNWAARRELLFKDPTWHYPCAVDLRAAQQAAKTSLGVIKVGRVERIWVVERPADELRKHRALMQALKSRLKLFDEPQMRDLDPQEFKVHLQWRCAHPDCPGGHTAGIMDWGLAQLGRKKGREAALSRMRELSDLTKHDLHLLMGNFAKHQGNFGIVGMWYPQTAEYLASKASPKRKPGPAQQLGLDL